jgi:hypothetical protein
MMHNNGYKKYVLDNVPRLISQLDRDPSSPTYGCFDRNHWQYKIRDFSSIVLQQGTLSLALLYSNNFPGNIYYHNKKIYNWVIASLRYWISQQLHDGSFNEYWPNEHGYPPTVFSLFSSAESFSILRSTMDEKLASDLQRTFGRAGKYISKNRESGAQNQETASLAALQSTLIATGDERLPDMIRNKREQILKLQSPDGWFAEYGGADIGYLSVSLNYLAEYYRLSNDTTVLNPIKKVIDFLQYFIHPDGTAGGDYGSRNTEYFLPGGLEIIAPEYPLAGSIGDEMLKNIDNPALLPRSVDDRYLSHYFLHSYIRALLHYKPRVAKIPLPITKDPFIKIFNDSKIIVVKEDYYYAIYNPFKGVLKIFSKSEEILNDCGYIAEIGRDIAVTNWLNPETEVTMNERLVCSRGSFFLAPRQIVPTPLTHIALRSLSLCIGPKLISPLKKQMILKNKKMPVSFLRKITFLPGSVIVEDSITSKTTIHRLIPTDGFSKRYVPSSKYFQTPELGRESIDTSFQNIKALVIEKCIDGKNGSLSFTIKMTDE